MDLAGPRGIHAQGRGCLGESHGWAVTPGRTRASVRRTPRPGALCASRAWTWGTPDRTSFPPQGNQGPPPKRPHYCSSGRHQEPIRILGQHSGSSGRNPKSGTRLREGPVKPDSERLGSPRRLDQSLKKGRGGSPRAALASGWKEAVLVWQGGKQVHTSWTRSGVPINTCRHAMRRAPPRWDRPPALGSRRVDGCMQPGRRQGNQMPGRWTGA